MYNFEISDEELHELNSYTKYIKYIRKGNIKTVGNKNWLLIDSSNFKYKKLLNQIEIINKFNGFNTNIIYDYNYVSKKYGFDENRFLNSIENYSHIVNIIIITISSSSLALAKFSNYCTFFMDYNSIKPTNYKKENIRKYVENNNFKVEDENILNELSNLSDTEIETVLTRAFINSLNDNSTILKKQYFPNNTFNSSQENLYADLDSLVGLSKAKTTIKEIINYLLIAKKRNDMPVLNMAFLGNPGTGKTTVAKTISKILSQSHILGKNIPFVEVSRETLIGKFIGSSEEKTMVAINNAIGGILFIDEAYSLMRNNSEHDFGKEVIDVLVNQMEIHKDDLCVIFAGYKEQMIDFLESNPGLCSRVPFKIEFEDFTEDEMISIFNNLVNKNFKFENGLEKSIKEHFAEARKKENFGNGRYVRNFYERLKIKQANRVLQEKSDINFFTNDDVEKTITSMQEVKIKEKNKIGF